MRRFLILFYILCLFLPLFTIFSDAQVPRPPTPGGAGSITVKDIDGSPSVSGVRTMRFTNGSVTDDGNNQVTVTTGGSPGGSSTQIQFNDSGSFGGDANLIWDKTNNYLTVGTAPATSSYGPLNINNNLATSAGGFVPGISVNIGTAGDCLGGVNPIAGDWVSIYSCINTNNGRIRIWGINPVVQIDAADAYSSAAIAEFNINNYKADAGDLNGVGETYGLRIISGGTKRNTAALHIRAVGGAAARWRHGIMLSEVGYVTGSTLIGVDQAMPNTVHVDYGIDLNGASLDKAAIRGSGGTLVGLSNNGAMEILDTAPAANAVSWGLNVPGASVGAASIVLSNYNGASWLELGRFTRSVGMLVPASHYFNFGTTSGSSGYGLRDNAGTLEAKNSGGSWAAIGGVTEAQLTFTDITTNNVSTTKHGFAPKAPNDITKFLDGTGAYSVPPGGTAGAPLFVQTADHAAVTSGTETSVIGTGVGSLTIPANWFTAAGTVLDISFSGKYSTGAVPGTLNLKLKFGSTVVGQTGAFTPIVSVTDGVYSVKLRLIARTVGGSGTVFVTEIAPFTGLVVSPGATPFANPTLGTAVVVDTTATQAVDVTATWGTAATNSITGQTLVMVGPGSAVSSVNGSTGAVTIAGTVAIFNDPGLRLTLTTGVPITTTDVTGAGTLYYTPYKSGSLVYYTGAVWAQATISEISLALTLTSGKNYDVFVSCSNSTTCALALGDAWTNDTTRAVASNATLGTQDGVVVLSSDATKLHIGTLRASGTNTTEASFGGTTTQVGGKAFLWNRFNQRTFPLTVTDTADNWSYTTDTWRVANGATAPLNCVQIVVGDVGSTVDATHAGNMYMQGSAARGARIGIGVNSSTVPSGLVQAGYNGAAGTASYVAASGYYKGLLGLGYNYLCRLERGGDGTSTFLGDNAGDGLQTGLVVGVVR